MPRPSLIRSEQPAPLQAVVAADRPFAGTDSAAGSLSHPERYLDDYHRHYPEASRDDLYFRLTRSIVIAGRRWRKLANGRIKAIGQTMARWETLFLVAFSRDALTQRELAQMISIEGPTMVRMLDLLAQEGLIERRQSEGDRRVTTNTITPAGERVVSDIKAVTDALRIELLRDIDPADLEVCLGVLTRIIQRLDKLNLT